jgi:carbamoyl-phosphate synthase small subunit
MTYPQIGNYGVCEADVESARIQVAGFVVREACRHPSNHTSCMAVGEYLSGNGIVAMDGVDTRALARRIRLRGAMRGIVATADSAEGLVEKVREWPGFGGYDAVGRVTCCKPYRWDRHVGDASVQRRNGMPLVVALDYGVKFNILRMLQSRGLDVLVLPADSSPETVLSYRPDGVFLANGPGDPAAVGRAADTIRALIGKLPIFGICLGHQLLCLALGGKTYKLKFGHRGANHPVKDLRSGRIEITSQNHGYCVEFDSLKSMGIEMTHVNLNDRTCEGIACDKRRIMSVQYHPEASPGPHDSAYLFERFRDMVNR